MFYKLLPRFVLLSVVAFTMGCHEDESPTQLSTEKTLTIEIDRRSLDDENTKEALLLARGDGEVVFIKEITAAEIVDYEILSTANEQFNLFLIQSTTSSPTDIHHVLIKSFLDIELDDNENWSFTPEMADPTEGSSQRLDFSIINDNSPIQYLNIIQASSISPNALENPTDEELSNLTVYVQSPAEKVIFQLKEEYSNNWKGYTYDYEEGQGTTIEIDLDDFSPITIETIAVDPDVEVNTRIVGLEAAAFNDWFREDNWVIKQTAPAQMIDANQYLLMDYGLDHYYTEITLVHGNEVHRLNHFGSEVPASFFTAPINLGYQGNDLFNFEVSSSNKNTYFKTNWTYADLSIDPKGVEIAWAIAGSMNKAYVMPEMRDCLSMMLSIEVSTSDFSIRSLGEERINTFYTGQGLYGGIFKGDFSYFPYSQWLENEGIVYRGYSY